MSNKVLIPELAERLSLRHNIDYKEALLIVKSTSEFFIDNINARNPIEIRGFGTVNYNKLAPYKTRNPNTGEIVMTPTKYVPRFKPAKHTIVVIEGE
ncbi:HU family DNA-binding protein [Shewanella colwelliana]|uniref:HU family DNA-binding protein n=1 Tax=Shewanella colwelliana TaxID=23 RepID=UPI0037353596